MDLKRSPRLLLVGLITAGAVLASSDIASAQPMPGTKVASFQTMDLQSFFANLQRTMLTSGINMSLFTGSHSSSSSSSSSVATKPQLQPSQPVSQPSGNDSLSNDRQRVFDLVNQARQQAGLPPYTYNNILQNSAQAYAEKMNSENFFSHVAPDGQTLNDRMHASGYYQPDGRSYYYGENIAVGQTSADQVMNDWMNSPEHKAAILSKTFKEIGIGRSGNYWVEHFGAIY